MRMGMFCRFGSALESRPVAATIWLKVVWMRLSESASGMSPSTVWRSFDRSRQASSCSSSGSAVCANSCCSASASVV